MVLSITIQLMKLYMHHSDNSETARFFMAIFLRCKDVGELERFSSAPGTSSTRMNGAFIPPLRNTWAAAVLTYRDLSKAWLAYFHFLYHGSLPRSLFLSYPHDYLIRDELFLIRWDAGVATGAQNATTPSGTEMAWFKQIFQNCVQSWKVACPKKQQHHQEDVVVTAKRREFETSFLAIVKNFFASFSVTTSGNSLVTNRVVSRVWEGVVGVLGMDCVGAVGLRSVNEVKSVLF
ncbi:hypothetical protein BDR26DRAFT_149979 [Obelidium mucronatum]|nr:hypothetical protein BDR26DRAFT_149979 [Obelidium mucronatum]